jgi:hypothetical protein
MNKLIRTTVICCITVFFLSAVTLYAQQSFEEWKRAQEQQFNSFLEEEDRAFTRFLEEEWKQFQSYRGMVLDPNPKPPEIPEAPVRHTSDRRAEFSDLEQKTINVTKPEESETPTSTEQPVEVMGGRYTAEVLLYGNEVSLGYDKQIMLDFSPPLTNKKFNTAWVEMAEWGGNTLLSNLKEYKDLYNLNDWGYFQLLNKVSSTLTRGDRNKSPLLTWFLLIKSGYDCRVCYADNQVYLMVPVRNKLYNILYFYFSSSSPYYYLFKGPDPATHISSFYTYEGDYPENLKPITMDLKAIPKLSDDVHTRRVTFRYEGVEYEVVLQADKSLIVFAEYFPQTEIPLYFRTPASTVARTSLFDSLRLIIEDKSELEAVNILLRFVQTAFDYKTDDQQFGREKPLFIEETLYYPYSDCEDRSILFAYLVRELLGLKVIGLDYPGHIATAVRFTEPVEGDALMWQGERYTVCDPTYINANAGMTMPYYIGKSPSVIHITN